ncbi:nuclear mRNA export, poly(A)+RNA binding protein [Borealophlyctis nickersoniae]|nr:nuclear mRNA export, poly(A)+RNA binding protein [Borealophlyctis nickersoniae]
MSSLSFFLKISGIRGNTEQEVVMRFLNRHADKPLKVVNFRHADDDTVVLTLEHAAQVGSLLKLSGIRYAGQKLQISAGSRPSAGPRGAPPPRSNAPSVPIIPTLTTLIRSRYNPEIKFLNLDNISNDPIMMSAGVTGFPSERSQFGAVICKLIFEICPEVESITFASNQLRTLAHFSTLPQRVPNVVNLSFKDNALETVRDIEPLSGRELTKLRELLMLGNPIRDRQMSSRGGDIRYKSLIKTIFPSIQVLDMEPVLEEIQFAVDATSVDLGLKVKGGFVDSESTASTVQDFMDKYFRLFDGNRAAVADFYGDHAVFSVSVNPQRSPQAKPETADRERGFERWGQANRNLARLTDTVKRVATLQVGRDKIINALRILPETRHPVDEAPERRLFLVDSYQIGQPPNVMLYVTIHGQFIEKRIRWSRSFSRTFIIVPAQPGSRQQLAGLPYMIINDQWVVRSYASNRAWTGQRVEEGGFWPVLSTGHVSNGQGAQGPSGPVGSSLADALGPPVVPSGQGTGLADALGPPMVPVDGGAPLAPQLPDMATLAQYKSQYGLNDVQHGQVIEFARSTGLNYLFSFQCLSQTGWSLNSALTALTAAKDQLPPEAWRV